MNKQVYRYKDIKDKILKGLDLIADPIRQTISPKGRNVIFESDRGDFVSTNDGATLAKNISVSDPIENAIISIVKSASLKSNTEAGDGTSTSIVLSQILIREGLKLIDNGMNPMDVKKELERIGEEVVKKIKERAIKVKNDKEIEQVAMISSNSDSKIAKDVVRVVKIVGEDGMVFLEKNNKVETEIEEDNGFVISEPLFSPELRNNPRGFTANYKDVPVLITDKRLYYPEEAETIIKTVLMNGHKAVVVVARDFIGQAPNVFIANHTQGNCSVLLIKDSRVTEKDNQPLDDLAVYLGGKVISEKAGSLVNNLTIDDFVFCDKAFADGVKSILTSKNKTNKKLATRVKALKKELAKDKDDESLKKRIASLTNGMVTVRVGGNTAIEVQERAYRYEDAIHAARAAIKDGYLVGGGVTMMSLYSSIDTPSEMIPLLKKLCEANVRQIAENCGEHPDSIVENTKIANIGKKTWTFGYNALTGQVEDLLKAGVIDPAKVTEMAIRNSISVASQIISSDFLILHEEDGGDEDNKNDK